MPTADILHNHAESRWEARMDDEVVGVADYFDDGTVLTFTHTFVGPKVRGGAVAGALIAAALTEARQTGRKVVPACSFVVSYLKRHPEYQELVADR